MDPRPAPRYPEFRMYVTIFVGDETGSTWTSVPWETGGGVFSVPLELLTEGDWIELDDDRQVVVDKRVMSFQDNAMEVEYYCYQFGGSSICDERLHAKSVLGGVDATVQADGDDS